MTFINSIVGVVFLVFFNMNVIGQLVWSTPTINSNNGDIVGIDLLVSGYQDIISAQGTIEFDESVLEYSHVSDFGLSSISTSSFGVSEVDMGKLSFSWYESDLVGKMISDNEAVFTIYFNVIGNSGQFSSIELVDQPVIAEFIDDSFTQVAYTYQGGSVNVNEVAGIEDISQRELNIFPNPATDWIQIQTDIIDSKMELLWYSMNGTLVRKDVINTNGNNLKLPTMGLTEGLYVICIGNDTLGFDNRLIQIL